MLKKINLFLGMKSATSEQNSSEADSERERNPALCHCVNKWNVNQNVSLVPRVEKAKSSQSFDYEFVILFYYFLSLDSSFCKVL